MCNYYCFGITIKLYIFILLILLIIEFFFQITNSIFSRGYFETEMMVFGMFCELLHIAAGNLGLFYLDNPFTCR